MKKLIMNFVLGIPGISELVLLLQFKVIPVLPHLVRKLDLNKDMQTNNVIRVVMRKFILLLQNSFCYKLAITSTLKNLEMNLINASKALTTTSTLCKNKGKIQEKMQHNPCSEQLRSQVTKGNSAMQLLPSAQLQLKCV